MTAQPPDLSQFEPVTADEIAAVKEMTMKDSSAIEKVNGGLPTPMSLIQLAMEKGEASVEALAKLMELQERWQANEARQAFEEAFAKFKAEAPRLEKIKAVDFGNTHYKFTPLDHIANELGPLLAKHRLSYNWKQDSSNGLITVTCTLRHEQGHSIENTLSGPADPSGSKNAIQAIGSAVSYLRRYTLLGVLGMATSDEDTDGMTMGSATDFVLAIEACSDLEELKRVYTEAAQAAKVAEDYTAMKVFRDAKDKRKAELANAE